MAGILDLKEGDLIEVIRDARSGESSMHRVTSALPSEDGLSVTIKTTPWPEGLEGSPLYHGEVYPDTGNAGCSWSS